jgi:hypothetical protein
LSRQLSATADRRFKFKKRSQLFIRSHNEALIVAAMCVGDPDCSPFAILSKTLKERVHERNGNDNANEEGKT